MGREKTEAEKAGEKMTWNATAKKVKQAKVALLAFCEGLGRPLQIGRSLIGIDSMEQFLAAGLSDLGVHWGTLSASDTDWYTVGLGKEDKGSQSLNFDQKPSLCVLSFSKSLNVTIYALAPLYLVQSFG